MKLTPLVATLAVLLTMSTGGCVVHFPLADNAPTLRSSDDSPSTADMSLAPTEANNRNSVKGNSPDTPE